jgi:hypothetical protein
MKVVIAGSRNISDYSIVVQAIRNSCYNITEVVSGTAVGVDRLGEQWARVNNIAIKEMPADWKRFGNSAGPQRNRSMAEYADAAVIIWDGHSKGTRNMIENMIRRKKPYYIGMTSATLEDFV